MISIIVPTLNRSDSLALTLKSLITQTFSVDQFEILVLDNGSTDATKQISEEFIDQFPSHKIRYISELETGLLSGRHRGASEAKGEILVFIDDDIEADTNWLQAIKDAFDDPIVQLVGGRNLPNYETDPPGWLQWLWSDHPYGQFCSELSLLDFGDQIREIGGLWVWGLNFSIRKTALIELGGFHPDAVPHYLQHFRGDGESGLGMKAEAMGYKIIYQPKALVFHRVPKQRMTYEYFDRRYFHQGTCDSYTIIRRNQGLAPISLIERIKRPLRKLKQTMRLFGTEKSALKARFQISYQKGYQFHQDAVRNNPKLLAWVLKENYWDYKYPPI